MSGHAARPWPRFMSARVAAEYARTSPWTIRRHVRAHGRRGRALVFTLEEVDRWMEGEALAVPEGEQGRATRARAPSAAASSSLSRIRELARGGGDRAVAPPGPDVPG